MLCRHHIDLLLASSWLGLTHGKTKTATAAGAKAMSAELALAGQLLGSNRAPRFSW
jgi:hypothetical protein